MGEAGDWFYISFADPERPTGTQFLGGCYVQAVPDLEAEASAMIFAAARRDDGTTLSDDELQLALALRRATALGINPGGEAQIVGPIPIEALDEEVPIGDRERLLTREEINP